jgi:predicted ATPase
MQGKRACEVCGALFPDNSDICPVCALRGALGNEPTIGESSVEPSLLGSQLRFEHYEILTHEDRTPVELGRGAMGVTYKAVDVNLQRTVALKVISAQLVGDESARRRFVREARAAASVRHPNVASVFHLGKSGDGYFYAMEFVDGEPLEKLIRRFGRLELKLALEIATQVASGLAAIHEENLVHRDIKPGNVMVKLKGDSSIAKIIDLGLAKAVAESKSETAVSIPGSFAGTPEFASPEQFAGVSVDIRSDLYSLGTTLWVMLSGRTPFSGTAGEVMYKHQHAPLPIDRLERVPQPVVTLLEVLLEKDPAQRFQTPTELLKFMPTMTEAIDTGRSITRQSFQMPQSTDSRAITRRRLARLGPKKISVARLPVTGRDVFGREEDIAFLDAAWANQDVNIVTIVAWAGVGKSTLVNHWLRGMAAEGYRSAQLVFGWSFYRQGTSAGSSSADEFIDAGLSWFGDPDARIGTAWEKGERLAKLIAHRRTLLVLDGLEPLQNPPGPQEGRLREPSLQALLRELAVFNKGLCVVTTRLPVADIGDHEPASALRRDLEQLSSEAGAKLLRALGVRGREAELRAASNEFHGHSLALTLLGSYLTDAYNGDIRRRKDVSEHLGDDVRRGADAWKVMESYQAWLGEGPELSILRMLGLFDRPTDEKALRVLLDPPAIRDLTEGLTDLSPTEWRTRLGRLRRARLLSGEDPNNPGYLDTHPLVREYFGDQLRTQRTEAWKECNKRLYDHYRTLAPQLPISFREMEPLFLAVICGCNAGLFREALHEVYIPRIQRGDGFFAANVLGARGALLSALAPFFQDGRWGSLAEASVAEHSLTAEDQLFVLTQAGLYLMHTRGMEAPEARICYERAEPLCHSLDCPELLYSALMGQWYYSLMTDKLSATLQIAKRVYSLAQRQNDARILLGGCYSLTVSFYYSGDFETARQYALIGVQTWRSENVQSPVQELIAPAVACLVWIALSEWHAGEIAACQTTMAEAIELARKLNDMASLGLALYWAGLLAHFDGNVHEVERLASDLIELSTNQTFASWLPGGVVLRGWARSASGKLAEGILFIENGIREYQATGAVLRLPYFLALKAEALHLGNRSSEALETIKVAEALAERSEGRWWCAEMHRLRGVFLAAIGADEGQIEASFRMAISTAQRQRSVSLEKRAEASYAEYRRSGPLKTEK